MTHISGEKVVAVGRIFFAIGLIVFGLQQLAYRDFVTRVVPSWPSAIPGRPFWAVVVGIALIAAGLAILIAKRARPVALALGACMLLSFALFGLPAAARDVWLGASWTRAGKALVIAGGAFAIAGAWRRERRDQSGASLAALAPLERLVPIGRFCLGAFMVLGGIQHFYWAQGVSRLVPAWVPPGRMFWTYVAGMALIAGGLGLTVRRTAPMAALFSGLMIFSWVFLVHLPLALADLRNANETTALFEALAFSGIAFVLAATVARD